MRCILHAPSPKHTARCGIAKALQAMGMVLVVQLYQQGENGSNGPSQRVPHHNQLVILPWKEVKLLVNLNYIHTLTLVVS